MTKFEVLKTSEEISANCCLSYNSKCFRQVSDLDRPEQLTQAWPLIGSILRYGPLRQVSLGVKLAEFVELIGELTRWGGGSVKMAFNPLKYYPILLLPV